MIGELIILKKGIKKPVVTLAIVSTGFSV